MNDNPTEMSPAKPTEVNKPRLAVAVATGWGVRNFLFGATSQSLREQFELLVLSPHAEREDFREQVERDGVAVLPLPDPIWSDELAVLYRRVQIAHLARSPTAAHRYKLLRMRQKLATQLDKLRGRRKTLLKKIWTAGRSQRPLKNRLAARWRVFHSLRGRLQRIRARVRGIRRRQRELYFCALFGALLFPLFRRSLLKKLVDWEPVVRLRKMLVEQRIDALLSTVCVDRAEWLAVAAAWAERIPVIASLNSWDHPTTKQFLLCDYDALLVWSERMREQTQRHMHPSNRTRLLISGMPQSDLYRDSSLQLTRAAFCGPLGLDPTRKIVVYSTVTPGLMPDEPAVLEQVARIFERMPGQPQMLVRLHPKDRLERYADVRQALERQGVVWTLSGTPLGSGKDQWCPDREDLVRSINTVLHGDVNIHCCYSTMMLDFGLHDKPVVVVAHDAAGEKELRVTHHEQWEHLQSALASGAVPVSYTLAQTEQLLREALEAPEQAAAERAVLVRSELGPCDGHVGERTVSLICETLGLSEALPAGLVEVDLGPVEEYQTTPVRVEPFPGQGSYLVVRDQTQRLRLLSATCPHKGGEVEDAGDNLRCPQHGWCFDRQSGQGLTVPHSALTIHRLVIREGRLIAGLPRQVTAPQRASNGDRVGSSEAVEIRLLHHACLEIIGGGFNLLTDPWLDGPAFFGSWIQYPEHLVDAAALAPDAIWISHEHSDHFHEATLAHFARSTPCYYPDFPNQRLTQRLERLGFSSLHPMPFGETVEPAPGVRLTCYEPASPWNDSILLLEIGSFRLLNLNDAGCNQRIAERVGPVDLLCSVFASGASSYPLTWGHLTDEQKISIAEKHRQGVLGMLKQAVAMYQAQMLLPFSGHHTLWHPSHRQYLSLMRKNTVDDVRRAFEGSPTRVLDLLPGESCRLPGPSIERAWTDAERAQIYQPAEVLRRLERSFDETIFSAHHPRARRVTVEEVAAYLLRLNDVPEIAFCEQMQVRIRGLDGPEAAVDLCCRIAGGLLTIVDRPPDRPNLSIDLPLGVLAMLVQELVSWDEADIGGWCRFERFPDIYHPGFWRMLQAPYYRKPLASGVSAAAAGIARGAVVAGVVEQYGEAADRILRRYGMYCAGCPRSTWETLEMACSYHGIPDTTLDRLVAELNRALVDERQ